MSDDRIREYGKSETSPATDEETVEVPVVDADGYTQWVTRQVNNLTDFEDFWPFATLKVDGELRNFARVLVSACYVLDLAIDELYEQRFLSSATGTELERIGARINAERRYGEEDPTYRTRVHARYQQRTSTATFEDIARLLETLLGIEDATISTSEEEGPKTIAITLPSSAISDAPFTLEQVRIEVQKALSPETTLMIGTDDTFVFSESDTSERGAGFGEGKWS